jgi:sugar phosphate isomerase/epimerase
MAGFLDEVALADYDTTELEPFGYLPTDSDRLADEFEQRSLRVGGGTLGGDFASRAARRALCPTAPPDFADGPRELDNPGWQHVRD